MNIGVPSGVGDVYWALCKLQGFRARYKVDRVNLCVQASQYDRALPWADMVSFVDSSLPFKFRSLDAEKRGIDWNYGQGLDVILWPNAVLDRGHHLRNWLDDLPLKQDFPIAAEPFTMFPGGYVVVYASSEAVNKAWVPQLGLPYWNALVEELGKTFDLPVVLIGASWDRSVGGRIRGGCYNIVGRTSLQQVTGILEGAAAVVGVISGMTILANHYRRPTIAFYPAKVNPAFPWTWTDDKTPYLPLRSDQIPDAALTARGLYDLSKLGPEQIASVKNYGLLGGRKN